MSKRIKKFVDKVSRSAETPRRNMFEEGLNPGINIRGRTLRQLPGRQRPEEERHDDLSDDDNMMVPPPPTPGEESRGQLPFFNTPPRLLTRHNLNRWRTPTPDTLDDIPAASAPAPPESASKSTPQLQTSRLLHKGMTADPKYVKGFAL